MFRYMQGRRMCPNCDHVWSEEMGKSIGNLTKVKFPFKFNPNSNLNMFAKYRSTSSGSTVTRSPSNGSSVSWTRWSRFVSFVGDAPGHPMVFFRSGARSRGDSEPGQVHQLPPLHDESAGEERHESGMSFKTK